MTGILVNEKISRKILKILYKNRNSGQPVILNNFWKKNIMHHSQIRVTLQHLCKDKEYIWCDRHREVGNTLDGIKQTLDNVKVQAKITSRGIEYYRNEHRDVYWNYLKIRVAVIATLLSLLILFFNEIKNILKLNFLFFLIYSSFPNKSQAQTFELEKTLLGHATGIETLMLNKEGTEIISGDLNGNIYFWELASGRLLKILRAHDDAVNQINLNKDGNLMCTASSDGSVKVWDLLTTELKSTIKLPDDFYEVYFAVFSDDNRYIYFGGSSAKVYKSDINGVSKPITIFEDKFKITDGLTSFNNDLLVFSSGYSIKFMNFNNDKITKEIGNCKYYVNNLVFSPIDTNLIISWCQDGTVNFWNILQNINLSSIKVGDEDNYSKLAFSSDGKFIITGSSGNECKIWDPINKNIIEVLYGHSDVVIDFKFTLDNSRVITCSYDGSIMIWRINE